MRRKTGHHRFFPGAAKSFFIPGPVNPAKAGAQGAGGQPVHGLLNGLFQPPRLPGPDIPGDV
jgi:hypothetical protein